MQEKRVALTPDGVHLLINNGHEVAIETGAGLGAAGPVSSLRDTMDAAIRDSISPNNLLDTVFDSDDYERTIELIKKVSGERPLWMIESHWQGYQ